MPAPSGIDGKLSVSSRSKIMLTAFYNVKIWDGDEPCEHLAVLIEGSAIRAIVPIDEIPSDAHLRNCHHQLLVPGLIDLQVYGAGGVLFSDHLTPEALRTMADALVAQGTTGFLLTLATNSLEVFRRALAIVKQHPHPALLGVHFEGPYLNPVKRGAHPLRYIRKPDANDLAALLEEGEGYIRMMTLAPECCTPDIFRLLTQAGVLISAGHSNASFDEATHSFQHGVKVVTHLFNAMSSFHHRQTGLPGATFLNQQVCSSIIPDGIHVDFPTLSIAKKILGRRLFLITDAVAETQNEPYLHVLNGDHYVLPDGTLSGSAISLLQGVRNCIEKAGIEPAEAFRMASAYPASLLNNSSIGVLKPGAAANLLLINETYQPTTVLLNGQSHCISSPF